MHRWPRVAVCYVYCLYNPTPKSVRSCKHTTTESNRIYSHALNTNNLRSISMDRCNKSVNGHNDLSTWLHLRLIPKVNDILFSRRQHQIRLAQYGCPRQVKTGEAEIRKMYWIRPHNVIAWQTRRSWTNNFKGTLYTVYTHAHIGYIRKANVYKHEWSGWRMKFAMTLKSLRFSFGSAFIRWRYRDVSRNTPQNGVLPSLVSMVSSVTNSHTGAASSLCSKIQYCQHKRARLEPYKSNPHTTASCYEIQLHYLSSWDSTPHPPHTPKAHVSPMRDALKAARNYHTR